MSTFARELRRLLAVVTALMLLVGAVSVEAFADEGTQPPPALAEGAETAGEELLPPEGNESAQPAEPVQPEEPAQPAEPVQPEGSVQPETPAAPAVPEVPEELPLPAEPMTTDVPQPEEEAEEEPEEAPEEELASEDPLYWKYGGAMPIASIPASFSEVKPRSLRSGETLCKGVDVSEFQVTNRSAYNIDWSKAAKAGVEFAIIRVGYRGTRNGELAKDAFYDQNIRGAQAAGLKVGLYIFSQATTTEEAREEAQYLVGIAGKYIVDLPLVFDYEEVPTVASRRLKMAELDRQLKTDICNAFCDEVEKSGYQSMVYTNLSMLGTDLYPAQLGRIWLAHWTEKSTYTGAYEYWQFGIGTVKGIPTSVDLDYWFAPNSDPTNPVVPQGGMVATPPTDTPAPTATPTPTATPVPTSTPEPVPAPVKYADVQEKDWFYDDVQWASVKKVAGGVGDNKFSPQTTATRGQVITMIHRLKGEPKAEQDAGFTDLRQDYYKEAVNWAFSSGVVNGTGEKVFSPDGKITREDLVTMLYRMKGSPSEEASLSSFTDAASIHSYAQHSMAWAVQAGLIKGYTDGTVRPGASATRAEVCAMLRRFSELA